MSENDLERRLQYVADLAARLRRVCPDYTDEQFWQLVLEIARMAVRFEKIDGRAPAHVYRPSGIATHPPIDADAAARLPHTEGSAAMEAFPSDMHRALRELGSEPDPRSAD